MDTFTLRLPRWPVLLRLLSRNPLVRTTDRIQALVLVLAVALSLLAIPIAAAAGTAVHDSRRQAYAQQADTRHTMTATVTDVPATQIVRTGTTTVAARWTAAGAEHTGAVKAQSTTKTGDPIEIWVDNTGAQVPAPTPTTRAAEEAATGALAIWISVTAIAAALSTLTRAICDRIRFTGWQHDLEHLGRQRRRPHRQPALKRRRHIGIHRLAPNCCGALGAAMTTTSKPPGRASATRYGGGAMVRPAAPHTTGQRAATRRPARIDHEAQFLC